MTPDLVYDVGLYDGSDSAYYLRLGYRVVAVEADPVLCAAARERFAREIAAGRLIIEECAIVEHPSAAGSVTFHVNRQNREWNSLVEANAGRRNESCEIVTVAGVRFESLLAKHGVPFYLKVDIEGMDHLCAEAIEPRERPHLVSLEFSDDATLDLLVRKGYTRFKCVRQTDLVGLRLGARPPRPHATPLARWIAQRPERIRKKILRLVMGKETARAKKTITLPDGTRWTFSGSSSGPFGDDADGPWLTETQLRHAWKPWTEARARCDNNWQHWFDLHAGIDLT